MKNLKWLLLCGGIAVATGVAIWLLKGPDPDAKAREFASAFKRQDWQAIYDMASNVEKRKQSWGADEYSSLLKEIASHTLAEIGEIEAHGDWAGQTTKKIFLFTFEAKRANGLCEKVRMQVDFLRGPEDWHPIIYKIPLDLHNLLKKPTRESLTMLVSACKRNDIKEFARMDDNLVFSIVRLEQYLEGKAKWNSIYTHERI